MQQDTTPPEQTDSTLPAGTSPPANDLNADMAPQPVKKSGKKLISVAILLMLLVVGAATYWYFFIRSDPPSQQNAVVTPITASSGKFYFTKNASEIAVYDPAAKKQEIVSIKLEGDNRAILASSAGNNQSIMFAANGKSALVASQTYVPNKEEIESSELSIFENGKETKLLTLPYLKGRELLTDWALSSDGSMVYYLTSVASAQNTDKQKSILHLQSMNIKEKVPKLIKSDISDPAMVKSPLIVNKEGVLKFYAHEDKVIEEHSVSSDKYSVRSVGAPTCVCSLAFPQALSPDGKMIMLDAVKDGEQGGFSYYTMNLADGKTTQLGVPDADHIQWHPWLWSADSSKLAFTVLSFHSEDKPEKEPRVEVMDVSTKKHEKLMSSTNPKDSFSILSWSLDGRLLAVLRNKELVLYDMTDKKVLETGIELGDFPDISAGYGWY